MVAGLNQIAGVASAGPAQFSGSRGVEGALVHESGQAAGPFSDLLTDAVGEVSRLEDDAQKAMAGLMSGTGVDVHQAMIATQKASMAFELSLAVRNKAVQAYQQVMSMQF
jgi:flagellar hook-basal body complex protein FliE